MRLRKISGFCKGEKRKYLMVKIGSRQPNSTNAVCLLY